MYIAKLILDDKSLEPYTTIIENRHAYIRNYVERILNGQSALEFAREYQKLGFSTEIRDGIKGLVFREWAPNAIAMSLVGDFNNWNDNDYIGIKKDNGVFEIWLPQTGDEPPIPHLSKIKVVLSIKDPKSNTIKKLYRVPTHIHYAIPDPIDKNTYVGIYWDFTSHHHEFTINSRFSPNLLATEGLRIYECHIGMSSEEEKIASYSYFQYSVLPRIIANGYNCIQFMAIVEHTYYASFGYHCNLFYAISSRYGTPTDFMRLVDAAHLAGLYVIIDIVQSHASPNVGDGLNQFDGTDSHYFMEGEAGNHPLWKSKCFNYTKKEVVQFLLGQLVYLVDTYHIDGFRFDGITSMLYTDHAINKCFTGDYKDYFSFHSNINIDAIAYLTLANYVLHSIDPPVFTIAEDVSGYPLLASSFEKGGIGFDYRMNMAIADKWIQLLKEKRLEEWHVGTILHTILNRRNNEKYISYNECHDQSLVGDKTIAFWLMDSLMYSHMSKLVLRNSTIWNGIHILHLIRLLTKVLGGEGYLNFMGNEFGHPEWIDFPRSGNKDSYHYCRRQWNLVDNNDLLYQYINNWDIDTNYLCHQYGLQVNKVDSIPLQDIANQIIAFEKEKLLFVFNFNCHNSYTEYRVPVREAGSYRCILSSDLPDYYGDNRVSLITIHETRPSTTKTYKYDIMVYCPTLCVNIYKKI